MTWNENVLLFIIIVVWYLMGVFKIVQGLYQGCQGAGRLRFCGSFSRGHRSLSAAA